MIAVKTNFEQISLAQVRKIVEKEVNSAIAIDSLRINKKTDVVTPPSISAQTLTAQAGWRQIAQQIQEETDQGKMIELAQLLVNAYDAQKLRERPNPISDES